MALLEFTNASGAGNWTVSGSLTATSLTSQDALAIASGGSIAVLNGATLNASTTVSGALTLTNPSFSLGVFGNTTSNAVSALTVTSGGTITTTSLRMHNSLTDLELQPGAVVNLPGSANGYPPAGPPTPWASASNRGCPAR